MRRRGHIYKGNRGSGWTREPLKFSLGYILLLLLLYYCDFLNRIMPFHPCVLCIYEYAVGACLCVDLNIKSNFVVVYVLYTYHTCSNYGYTHR